jgi:hypothetical protein
MYTIGISIDLSQVKESIFINGLKQNVIFLYDLLHDLGLTVYFVYFQGDVTQVEGTEWSPYSFLSFEQSLTQLNVIIFAMIYPHDFHLEKYKANGIKTVYYCMGNKWIPFIESCIHQDSNPNQGEIKGPIDEIWCIPQQFKYKHYLEIVYHAKVKEVPYIWHPKFITSSCKEYQPFQPKCIGVFEPNMSTLKNSIQPLINLSNLDCMDKVYFFCCKSLRTHSEFVSFVKGLSSSSKFFFEGRHPISSVLNQYVNVGYAYQFENELNYLYLDLLWMGYPLIHNSPWLKDLGFYYESKEDVKKWIQWIEKDFDLVWDEYKKKWREEIQEKYMHPSIQDTYQNMLQELFK